MRKTIKIGVIMLVVGVIMLIFGIANNGIQSVYWDRGFKIAKHQSKTYYPDKITDITLNSSDNVTIKRGDTATIAVSSQQALPTVTTKNGHVTVNSKTTSKKQVGYFFGNGDWDNRVVITVPRKTTLTAIKGTKHQSGNVRLQNVTVDHVEMLNEDNTVGLQNVQIKKDNHFVADILTMVNVTAPSLSVEAGSDGGAVQIRQSQFTSAPSTIKSDDGNIRITQTKFTTAKVHADDGSIHLSRNQAKRLSATTSDGNIHLGTNKRVGLFIDSSDGNLNVFGHRHSTATPYRRHPNASQQYHLTTEDGNIVVTTE